MDPAFSIPLFFSLISSDVRIFLGFWRLPASCDFDSELLASSCGGKYPKKNYFLFLGIFSWIFPILVFCSLLLSWGKFFSENFPLFLHFPWNKRNLQGKFCSLLLPPPLLQPLLWLPLISPIYLIDFRRYNFFFFWELYNSFFLFPDSRFSAHCNFAVHVFSVSFQKATTFLVWVKFRLKF